jgi:outer membrane protein assembly factor BamB
MTSPENAGKAEAVVRLSASLTVQAFNKPNLTGGDVDFGGSPMLFRRSGCPLELAVENKSGVLLLYKAGAIGAGAIQRLQVGNIGDWQFNAIPTYDPVTHLMYVADSSSSGKYGEGLIAFRVRSGCTLDPTPVWQRSGGPGYWVSMSPPTVANGVVYYGDGSGDAVRAYDAATGKKLWGSGSLITDGIWSAPLVANGRLFVGSWDGNLYAFGP